MHDGQVEDAAWGALIPDDQWQLFLGGATTLEMAGVPFLLAGAMALASYTGISRSIGRSNGETKGE